MAQHKHWPVGTTEFDRAPWCDLPTRKACDARWTEYLHNHLGTPCVKAIQESKTRKGQANKVPTCTLSRPTAVGLSFEQSLIAARATVDSLPSNGSHATEPTDSD